MIFFQRETIKEDHSSAKVLYYENSFKSTQKNPRINTDLEYKFNIT